MIQLPADCLYDTRDSPLTKVCDKQYYYMDVCSVQPLNADEFCDPFAVVLTNETCKCSHVSCGEGRFCMDLNMTSFTCEPDDVTTPCSNNYHDVVGQKCFYVKNRKRYICPQGFSFYDDQCSKVRFQQCADLQIIEGSCYCNATAESNCKTGSYCGGKKCQSVDSCKNGLQVASGLLCRC